MSNLIPVRRTDKNGVLTTKHVRADSAKKTAIKVPPVVLSPATPARQLKDDERSRNKRLKAMSVRRPRSYSRSSMHINANPNLSHLFRDRYSLSASDDDLYGLFEKMSLSDAIVLADNNMTPEKLTSKTMKLIDREDNSDLVKVLRQRAIRFDDYVSVANDPLSGYSQEHIVDAAECLSLYPKHESEGSFGPGKVYSSYLLQGQIRLSDLKSIGIDNCESTDDFAIALLRIKSGKAKCTAAELGEMLNRTKKLDFTKERRDYETRSLVGTRTSLAVEYGADFAERVHNPVFVQHIASESPKAQDRTPEERAEFCEFLNELRPEPYDGNHEGWFKDIKVFDELWEAGVAPDKARDGMDANLTTSQIIAIHANDIAPSVAGGWL